MFLKKFASVVLASSLLCLVMTTMETATAAADPALGVSAGPAGSWVGQYGTDGYALAAWDGGTDLVAMPGGVTFGSNGTRYTWETATTDPRALEPPSGTGSRRVGVWYTNSSMVFTLNFADAYEGFISLYSVDWDDSVRRHGVEVDDGSGTPTSLAFNSDYHNGLWGTAPIDVEEGGSVEVTVTHTGGWNAVVSGVFLDSSGAGPQTVEPSAYPGGSWVSNAGNDGYILADWSTAEDLVSLPDSVHYSMIGSRYTWATTTIDTRALQSPDETFRRASTWYDPGGLDIKLTFDEPYVGKLSIYSLDYDNGARSQNITIRTPGATYWSQLSDMTAGAWVSVDINMPASSELSISAIRTGSNNAVVAGIFLGGPGLPYPREQMTAVQPPQGSWRNHFGMEGYALAAWNNGVDAVDLPDGATMTIEKGGTYFWQGSTTDVRALENPPGSSPDRRYGVWYSNDPTNQVKIKIHFTQAYSGNFHMYAADWDDTVRGESVVLTDDERRFEGSLDPSFHNGKWLGARVSVAAGNDLTLTVTQTGSWNAVVGGIFFGSNRPVAVPSALNVVECAYEGGNLFLDQSVYIESMGENVSGCVSLDTCASTWTWVFNEVQNLACENLDFLAEILGVAGTPYRLVSTFIGSTITGEMAFNLGPPTRVVPMVLPETMASSPAAPVVVEATTGATTSTFVAAAAPVAATGAAFLAISGLAAAGVEYIKADDRTSTILHRDQETLSRVEARVKVPASVAEDDIDRYTKVAAMSCLSSLTLATVSPQILAAFGISADDIDADGFVGDNHLCELIPIYMPGDTSARGGDMHNTTNHIRMALGVAPSPSPMPTGLSVNPSWIFQTRKSPPNLREWLKAMPIYNSYLGRDDTCLGVVGDNLTCDEFPYASSTQGGELASPPVSYYNVPSIPENGSQRDDLLDFYNGCNRDDGDSYLVVPLPAMEEEYSPQSAFIC